MAFDEAAIRRHMLVTPGAMAAADERTIAGGTERAVLIRRAARAITRVLRSRYAKQPTVILCGPGHNGADGISVAEMLIEAGWPVEVVLLDENQDLSDRLGVLSRVRPSGTFSPRAGMLVIDALFGAGLSRLLEGEALMLIERLELSQATCLAIDLPSGLDGQTGEIRGAAPYADATVTFHRLKPGHLLGHGPERCGKVFLADIGIEAEEDDAGALHNHPDLWRHLLRPSKRDTHKYEKGHVTALGGPGLKGGAGRLAARAAAVSGAGAVTYLTPLSSAEFAAASFDAVMVAPFHGPDSVTDLTYKRGGACVFGPGMGHGDAAKEALLAVLETEIPCVLDADALTLFEKKPGELFEKLHPNCVLTPHEGEFSRLFGEMEGSKLERACKAAKKAGAVVLLKGSTTVIAGDGLPLVNSNGSAALATAGAGDVLAGLIAGFLAQGMAAAEAAAAGAYIHADAASGQGPGLEAEALPPLIASVLKNLVAPTH
ncbi:NAD(P)H-hydrate dehydratase [Parvularcula maris]|uniref:Bifunctional NAD(P)H-hydrate repair enzyme n=1 Tax=Parvularcula maris TaxID=2965077 RepID=A0A9X2LCT0_9PROT|nr:NAD(P)H-hydrate dehydratase [Parvularcula maris]MCQ8186142.1 NAD(P)H-hydrate dehydratase [Parvularcula maris]